MGMWEIILLHRALAGWLGLNEPKSIPVLWGLWPTMPRLICPIPLGCIHWWGRRAYRNTHSNLWCFYYPRFDFKWISTATSIVHRVYKHGHFDLQVNKALLLVVKRKRKQQRTIHFYDDFLNVSLIGTLTSFIWKEFTLRSIMYRLAHVANGNF